MALTKEKGLEFGVKLTNTFPVDVAAKEITQRRDVYVRTLPVPIKYSSCKTVIRTV